MNHGLLVTMLTMIREALLGSWKCQAISNTSVYHIFIVLSFASHPCSYMLRRFIQIKSVQSYPHLTKFRIQVTQLLRWLCQPGSCPLLLTVIKIDQSLPFQARIIQNHDTLAHLSPTTTMTKSPFLLTQIWPIIPESSCSKLRWMPRRSNLATSPTSCTLSLPLRMRSFRSSQNYQKTLTGMQMNVWSCQMHQFWAYDVGIKLSVLTHLKAGKKLSGCMTLVPTWSSMPSTFSLHRSFSNLHWQTFIWQQSWTIQTIRQSFNIF